MKHGLLHFIIFCLFCFSIVACSSSNKKDEKPVVADPDTLRTTAYGKVIGTNGLYNSHTWQGIPFSRPPVGDLRWRAPQEPESWQGIREALKFNNICPQLANQQRSDNPVKDGTPIGDEDCLYLNIWTPKFEQQKVPKAENRLPVMVWLHGGGNVIGHGGNYNGGNLAVTHRLVVVTINYRLGPFGWFSHPALREKAYNAEEKSGNFGTLDLIRALNWVKRNIEAFGGDPSNVTVFGQSAGGYNIFSLLVSPKAKGLFHKAISQSGETSFSTLKEGEGLYPDQKGSEEITSTEAIINMLIADRKALDRPAARSLLNELTSTELVDYLRNKNRDELLNAFRRVDQKGSLVMGMQIHSNFMDGVVIPDKDPVLRLRDTTTYNRVPIIFGTTRDETALLMAFDPKYVKKTLGVIFRINDKAVYSRDVAYLSDSWKLRGVDRAASAVSESFGPYAFAYRFDWDEEPNFIITDFSKILGAAHGTEIPFVFGHWDMGSRMINLLFSANDAGRFALSKAMMSYWAEFAYNGNPGKGRDQNLPEWKPWNNQDGKEKLILLDTASDGGIRMSPYQVTFENLVSRIESDNSLATQKDKCSMYVKMFHGRFEWNQNVYEKLARKGCNQFDPLTLKN